MFNIHTSLNSNVSDCVLKYTIRDSSSEIEIFFFIQQLNIQAQRKFYLPTESCNPITVRRIFSLEVESMLHALKQNE